MLCHEINKYSDLNIFTRKGEAEGRGASLQREGKVIAGVAAYCAVGAVMSLLLLVIMYTHGTMDRMTSLVISFNVHYVHFGGDNKYSGGGWICANFWLLL